MKQDHLATIAAFTALGDQPRLKAAIEQALDHGLTINEAKDALVQLYAYCGFPRSLNALATLMATVQERQDRGRHDAVGRAATPLAAGTDMLQQGTATQTALAGAPVKGPLFDFAPDIDRYLKKHLFGDIFASDVLTHAEREIVTLAALASLHGVDAQLAAHFRMARHAGLGDDALHALTRLLAEQVDPAIGQHAAEVLQGVPAAT